MDHYFISSIFLILLHFIRYDCWAFLRNKSYIKSDFMWTIFRLWNWQLHPCYSLSTASAVWDALLYNILSLCSWIILSSFVWLWMRKHSRIHILIESSAVHNNQTWLVFSEVFSVWWYLYRCLNPKNEHEKRSNSAHCLHGQWRGNRSFVVSRSIFPFNFLSPPLSRTHIPAMLRIQSEYKIFQLVGKIRVHFSETKIKKIFVDAC